MLGSTRSWAIILTAIFCGLIIILGAAGEQGDRTMDERYDIAGGNNAFACDVYGKLRETESGNLFFSPFSIRTALAMTYAGARGTTAGQMAEVLHFGEGQETLHAEMGAYIKKLNASAGPDTYLLTVANALWGQEGFEFIPEFLQLNDAYYGAGLKTVDFIGDTEGARQAINQWVEEETKEKIKDLIPAGTLQPLTRLVLTNAIYFKGTWEIQFDPSVTADEAFFISAEQTVQAPMMHLEEKFKFFENNLLKVIELPYNGDRLVMDILLPNEIDGLANLEAALTAENLEAWLGALEEDTVTVALPRFKTESAFRLDDILKALGMVDAFSEIAADFTGITAKPELFISAVVHKAFVDVNEEGTEAAAATAVVMGIKSAGTTNVFRADHPFIFLIRDLKSGAVLFLGRLVEPQ
jgi:serpin B